MSRKRPILHLSWIAILGLFLSGCGGIKPFKAPIAQGIVIEPAMLEELQVGLSKQQVRSLLGPHYGQHPFRPHIWDYTYATSQQNNHPDAAGHLRLEFDEQGFLSNWQVIKEQSRKIKL
ncbi:outer membrane protein assembly factor BamE [Thiomicrospira sp. ALE5]|uniref:outer membrane protein assembly factor BamE n=1 Tax=Thiomicrospira sp. ALE5 TaxID=748650 RepID=UPI0008E1BD39|nr:outer membrane protein assembly factor BamE [Thiomicrospira sp. ALE5]SFR51443.1 Beta-barrel assembly machine subunit BamE [Thiomicrospira sp. ALE5]